MNRVTDMLDLQSNRPHSFKCLNQANDEIERLRRDRQSLQTRILELEKSADTDPLLPVYNRRAFVREIDRARNVMARYDILSSVIYFDLNDFKRINDRYGHGIGDEILRLVGGVLNNGVRDCDLVARLGGDEFGVLLFKTDKSIARAKASVLACRIAEQSVDLPTGPVSITVSWGLATCEAEDTADLIMSRADRAMYQAKKQNAA